MAGIKEESERWENTIVKKSLQKFPERKEQFVTSSGIAVKRLQHAASTRSWSTRWCEPGFPRWVCRDRPSRAPAGVASSPRDPT